MGHSLLKLVVWLVRGWIKGQDHVLLTLVYGLSEEGERGTAY